MKTQKFYSLCLAAVITIVLSTAGCSGKSDLLKDVSGNWQESQNKAPVEIHLVGDAKTITIDGQTYAVTVEKVEMVNYLVNLKAQNGSATPESWSIQQVWDTNGDGFKIAFNHNGVKAVLVPKAQS